jgi:hypothetical protein
VVINSRNTRTFTQTIVREKKKKKRKMFFKKNFGTGQHLAHTREIREKRL